MIKIKEMIENGVIGQPRVFRMAQNHHITDKDTLHPADSFSSLTVLTKNSGLADALSTALFCMSYEEGCELARKVGADVIWIFSDGTVKATEGAAAITVPES